MNLRHAAALALVGLDLALGAPGMIRNVGRLILVMATLAAIVGVLVTIVRLVNGPF